jgi:hypothetical protein
MELTLQGKSLVFAKNELFKAEFRVLFFQFKISSLKKTFLKRLSFGL